jgi:predicted ATPase
MKIKFSNLGTIQETQLDLRPLTVIIGPNNSNKTYVAYSIYGLLKKASTTVSRRFLSQLSWQTESKHLISIEINHFIDSFLKEFKHKITDFKDDLDGFFQDSSHQLFSKTTFEMALSQEQVKQAIAKLVKPKTSQSLLGEEFDISVNSNVLLISNREKNVRLEKDEIREMGMVEFIFALNEQLFPNPFLLPAERNAFIITYKMLAKERMSLLTHRGKKLFRHRESSDEQFEILRTPGEIYPESIEDFLDFLADAELQTETHQHEFKQLADQIEHDILNNNKIFYEPTVLAGKKLKVQVNNGLTIDLYNASSSVKQLTPLLLYLRYHAKKNDLLIIDEPELNLHPEAQAQLLEVFTILVNLGINVLLTTHSPYFMEHLNTLIIGRIDNSEALKKQAEILYFKHPSAFISLDKLSVYEMRNNQLHSLKDEDYGIRWDTLSDVSHDLLQKHFQVDENGMVEQ